MNNDDIAARLLAAVRTRTATTPITDEISDLDSERAYVIQDALVRFRIDQGSPVVGAKLGLTSAAKQRQMNVDEPLYGWLTSDMHIETGGTLHCDQYIQPRCEPEIAFVLDRDLSGSHITATHVLDATSAVVGAIDVLDSRYAGYSFTITDVIADNASSAGFTLGGIQRPARGMDLKLLGCAFYKNGQLMSTASGAAVLGHPAASVAWMVRALAQRGSGLRAGTIVLSGALTEAVPVSPGDSIVAEFDGLGSVELPCR
jgi:2-oxo-3-hexenedioate decarboxylase